MFINLKNFVVASLLFLVLTTIALGQGTSGSIEGTVIDQNSSKIDGATIKIENSNTTTGFEKIVTSDEKGYFIVDGLQPGSYKITVSAENFRSFSKEFELLVDKTTPITPILEISASSGPHDIAPATNPNIDTRNSQTDTNISKQTIADLPRDTTFSSILKYAPNVRPEPLAGGFQIDGGSGAENMFVIDGQEVTNYRMGILNPNNNLPIEFLQELQVKSTGFEAEYQGATGGIVNVVTVGGNNNWQGNVGLSFTPNSFQGDVRPILNRFGSGSGEFEYFTRKKMMEQTTFQLPH